MTAIYTDQHTGKKYDRQLLGVSTDPKKSFGCAGCTFSLNADCPAEPCVYRYADKHGSILKRVYFVFKERTA